MRTTEAERITAVEVEVRELKRAFEEHKIETKEDLSEIKEQLKDLLELRWKGTGAFWLASGLVGTGIISLFWQFLNWLKG